jgi:hypothetical protein
MYCLTMYEQLLDNVRSGLHLMNLKSNKEDVVMPYVQTLCLSNVKGVTA